MKRGKLRNAPPRASGQSPWLEAVPIRGRSIGCWEWGGQQRLAAFAESPRRALATAGLGVPAVGTSGDTAPRSQWRGAEKGCHSQAGWVWQGEEQCDKESGSFRVMKVRSVLPRPEGLAECHRLRLMSLLCLWSCLWGLSRCPPLASSLQVGRGECLPRRKGVDWAGRGVCHFGDKRQWCVFVLRRRWALERLACLVEGPQRWRWGHQGTSGRRGAQQEAHVEVSHVL